MRYCNVCVMPDTRPGLIIDEHGVCSACRAAEQKKKVDWNARMEELKDLCSRYRNKKGDYYDCIITGSGGKDSHFQTHIMKDVMKMNPLLLNVANFSWTETGRRNFENWSEAFSCDILSLHLNRNIAKKMARIAFEEFGSPNWYWDQAVYAFPLWMAIKLEIPLVVYGENISFEYGGPYSKETYRAGNQIKNNVVKDVDWQIFLSHGISMKDLQAVLYPPEDVIKSIEPIYLGYFVKWDGYVNYQVAKRYGFRDIVHEWKREGYIEDYDQIDAIGYLVHPWLKYPKYGHARATDVASYWIRNGYIKREEGIRLVKDHDHKLDQKVLQDFLAFTGYTHQEFWNIVEKYWNQDIFEKIDGLWRLKEPIYKHLL